MRKKSTGNIVEFLDCLSFLESRISILYKNLSDKVEVPLVKALLKEVAIDSEKHSILAKGMRKSIQQSDSSQKECLKDHPTLQTINRLIKQVDKIKSLTLEDLDKLSEVFITLESTMGEEYFVAIQMKTLERMTRIINIQYSIDLTKVKSIFLKIIKDEERHIEVLETIRQLATKKEQANNTPFVKYQNPNAW